MGRPLPLEFSGAIYHLTGRGNAGQRIFFSNADGQLFMDTALHDRGAPGCALCDGELAPQTDGRTRRMYDGKT
jgi:hypothetical protein